MRRLLAAACLAAASAVAAQDRLCPSGPAAAEPQPATVPGCANAQCTAVGDETLCTCQTASGHRYERRRGAQLVQHWPTEVSPLMGPAAFEVRQADIDGDGRPEWLVARLQGMSNGLGVSYHTLCVLWPQGRPRAPLCREVEEWRSLTVWVQEAGRAACSLVSASWQPGREPGRGPGTYAVGRFYRVQGSGWQLAADRPPVSRRLLKAFDDERETLPERNAERLWYLHPGARPAPR
jgi:hypothetical protein